MNENHYSLSYHKPMKGTKTKGLPEIRKAGNLKYEEVKEDYSLFR